MSDRLQVAVSNATNLSAVPNSGGFRVRSFDSIVQTPVEWLWHRYIPRGKLTIIDGLPKTGKSTIAFDLAARVSIGAPMPNELDTGNLQPASVLIIATEDGAADTIKPRLALAGANMERIFEPDLLDNDGQPRDIQLPGDLPDLEHRIRELGISLVIIDPLTGILDASTNAHSDPDVRRALRPFVRLAETTGAAIVCIRHLNKASGSSAMIRGGGSIAFAAIARSVLLVGRHPESDGEERGVLARTAGNLSKAPPSLEFTLMEQGDYASVHWGAAVAYTADDLVSDPGAKVTKEAEAEEFLRDILADGPVPSKEVEEAANESGIAVRTLNRAKAALRIRSGRSGNGWVWSLPE